jgi:hypothetical protein
MDSFSICLLITLCVGIFTKREDVFGHLKLLWLIGFYLINEITTYLFILAADGPVYNLDFSAFTQLISLFLWYAFFRSILRIKWFLYFFIGILLIQSTTLLTFLTNEDVIVLSELDIQHYFNKVTIGTLTTTEIGLYDTIERLFICTGASLVIAKLLKRSLPNSVFYPNLLIHFSILLFYAGGFYHGIISYLLYEYDASAGEYTSIVFQVLYYLHYTLFIIAFLWNYLPSFSWPRSSRSLS